MATSFTVSCLQTQPKPDFDSAIEEGLKLAEKSLGENPSIICFPEYCGGLKSKNGRFIPPHKDEENHPFLNEFKSFANKNQIRKLKMIGYDLSDFKAKVKESNVIEDLTLPKGFISFEEGNPKSILYKQAWNYLTKERKLSPQTIKQFKMGYVSGGQYDSRVVIPSYDIKDELNYWVTRTYIKAKPKYLNPDSDKEQIIFNECCLNWDSDIYLVEGPFDHLVVHNSIPILGKKISDKLMHSLFHKASANIIILLDSDAWGDAKKHYAKLNVGKLFNRIKIIKMDDDYDVAKVHEDFGREGVINVMRNSFKLKESVL